MLKLREKSKIDGYLFADYSKKKLQCLSKTYEELARMYRDLPQENSACDNRKDKLYQMQFQEAKHVFANHLEEISEAFAEVADTVVHVCIPVEHKRKALIQYLKKRGMIVRELMFLEGDNYVGTGDLFRNKISIEVKVIGRHCVSAEELGALLSDFFDRRLIPSPDGLPCVTRSYNTFIFEDEPPYMIIGAVSRAVKEGEKISGDNFSLEEYNQNRIVMMIADGMGSGEQACQDSQSVIEFMEKFMEAGFQKEKAFAMVNGAVASQSHCCNLTTLDLCAVNLLTGDAEFIKAGAAASYLKREGKVEEISADTLPLGSLEMLCPMMQTVRLKDSDMLIMLSDGVADAFESTGTAAIEEIIARSNTASPKELSDLLLKCAISCQGGHVIDDMTIMVCSVFKKPGLTE